MDERLTKEEQQRAAEDMKEFLTKVGKQGNKRHLSNTKRVGEKVVDGIILYSYYTKNYNEYYGDFKNYCFRVLCKDNKVRSIIAPKRIK